MTLEIRQDLGFNYYRRNIDAMTLPRSVIDLYISIDSIYITISGSGYQLLSNIYKRSNKYSKEIVLSSFKSTLEWMKDTRGILFKALGTLDGCHEVLKSSVRLINPTVLYLGLGTGLTTIGLIGILFSSWLQGKKIAELEKKDARADKDSNALTSRISPVKIRNISVVLAFSGLALTTVTIAHLWMSGKAYRGFLETGRIDSHGVKANISKAIRQEEILSDPAPSGQDLTVTPIVNTNLESATPFERLTTPLPRIFQKAD